VAFKRFENIRPDVSKRALVSQRDHILAGCGATYSLSWQHFAASPFHKGIVFMAQRHLGVSTSFLKELLWQARPCVVALTISMVWLSSGCSGDNNAGPSTADPDPASYGYKWTGEGTPTNFGGDYVQCENQVAATAQLEGASPYKPGSEELARTDPKNIRALKSCLEGLGWTEMRE